MNEKITRFAKTPDGAWLNAFNWRGVKIRALPFGVEGAIQAAYFAVTDSIRIAPDSSDEVWFGMLIHELRHAWQRHRYGLAGYLARKTFGRRKLEDEAVAAELAAVEWAGRERLEAMKRKQGKKKQ